MYFKDFKGVKELFRKLLDYEACTNLNIIQLK